MKQYSYKWFKNEDQMLEWLNRHQEINVISIIYLEPNLSYRVFYYTEEEFQTKTVTGDIIKYKGLGQMDEDDLKNSMFSPEFQHMDHIEYNFEGVEILEQLMGNQVQYRKDFVFNNIDFSEFNL
jgi:DNA gyrase/topoisomerase IV subunit B